MSLGAADVHAALTLERQRLAELHRTAERRRVRAEVLPTTPRVRDHFTGALIRIGLTLSSQQRRRWLQRESAATT